MKVKKEDLETEDYKLLFDRLLEDLLNATNMFVEGILAQLKAAVPKGKAKSSSHAEKLAWLSYLGQELHQHLESGRRDCRREQDRGTLIQAGVPLEHHYAQPTWERPDVRWLNANLYAWRSANQAASQVEEDAERRRFISQWRAWDAVERATALSVLERNITAGTAPQQKKMKPDKKQRKPTAPIDPWWDCGDQEWPLRPPLLQEFLQAHTSNRSMGVAGLANKALHARDAERCNLIVRDQNCIPDDKVYVHRLPCTELHPGLCASRDHAIYGKAILLAKNLETALDKSWLHKFFALVSPDGQDRGVR